jgi:hypothetical protein
MIDQAVVARYCRHCGASLCGPVAYCSSCGQSITDRPVPQEVPTEDRANGATRHYASLWRRLAARTIDVLLIVITYYSASFLVGAVWGSMAGAPPTDEQIATVSNWLFAFAALASVAYLWFGTAAGGTFGQRALGLRIVRKGSDRAPGVMHAFVRILVSGIHVGHLGCRQADVARQGGGNHRRIWYHSHSSPGGDQPGTIRLTAFVPPKDCGQSGQ